MSNTGRFKSQKEIKNKNRRKILKELLKEPQTFSQLNVNVDLSKPVLSAHLKELRGKGIIHKVYDNEKDKTLYQVTSKITNNKEGKVMWFSELTRRYLSEVINYEKVIDLEDEDILNIIKKWIGLIFTYSLLKGFTTKLELIDETMIEITEETKMIIGTLNKEDLLISLKIMHPTEYLELEEIMKKSISEYVDSPTEFYVKKGDSSPDKTSNEKGVN